MQMRTTNARSPGATTAVAGPKRWRVAALACLLAALGPVAIDAHAQDGAGSVCGSLQNAFGPFDYRTTRGEQLNIVEINHFTPKVEALIRGITSERLGGDIDYTLRAFPNHHRALLALSNYAEKYKLPKDPDMNYSFECYFDRAVRFQRDDPIARMLYAEFLRKQHRIDDAKKQLAAAASVAEADQNPFTFYNVGMLYTDLKDYDSALKMAQKAYKLGFPRPGLRDRLKAAGKWQE